MSFIIDHRDLFALGASGDDADADEAAVTRDALAAIVDRGSGHLTEGQQPWDKFCEWEMQLLETLDASEREAQLDRIDKMFLARLQTPHSAYEETSQAYSSFNSTHRPAEDYEKLMVAVTKARSGAVNAWNARETSEIALRNAPNALETYSTYLAEDKQRSSKRRSRHPRARGANRRRGTRRTWTPRVPCCARCTSVPSRLPRSVWMARSWWTRSGGRVHVEGKRSRRAHARSRHCVTHLAQHTDDDAMRDPFSQFGLLLDVRWPSKKLKSTRRFCYVEFRGVGATRRARA